MVFHPRLNTAVLLLGGHIAGSAAQNLTLDGSSTANYTYGADNFYRAANVTIQPVFFPAQNTMTIAGNLFLPRNIDRALRAPAIITGHPMGAVKEQSANLYATKMAEQGFVALSIDLPFWGSSEGLPRNSVWPDLYAEAFSATVDYLGTQPFVNRSRIGGIAFLISAAKIDPRLRAIATASMYDMGEVSRSGIRGATNITQRQENIASSAEQRWAEVDGAEPLLVGGTPQNITDESTEIDREFFDYYRTSRGEVTPPSSLPNRTTYPTLSSQSRFVNFYPFEDIETISPRPVLFIAGDQAHSREFSETAYERAGEPKELYWVQGAGHVDLYDRTELIPWGLLTGFFTRNLA